MALAGAQALQRRAHGRVDLRFERGVDALRMAIGFHPGGLAVLHIGAAQQARLQAGMIGLVKSLAAEYARRGVTANCVAPGFIASPMTDKLNDKQREAILARVPAARLGSADDVAAAVVYLASAEAAYVTGQTLHVNGGMAMP